MTHSMSKGRNVTVRGVVVARHASGEGSVRVSLYTDLLGLVDPVAKSAREERSKLRAHLMVGTLGTFTLVRGEGVWRITGVVDATNIYFALSGKPRAQKAAAETLGIVRKFVRGEERDLYFFEVLSEFLRTLPGTSEDKVSLSECAAVLRMLAALGYVSRTRVPDDLFSVSYDTETLDRVSKDRTAIVKTINQAISASGL